MCYFQSAIAVAPLQIYASGLTFCPEVLLDSVSNTRSDAQDEEYKWSTTSLNVLSHWSPRMQVWALPRRGSSRATFIAATKDGFMMIFVSSGTLLLQRTNSISLIRLHSGPLDVQLGSYSADCTHFACLSTEGVLMIWDLEKESLLRILDVNAHACFNADRLLKILHHTEIAMTFTSNNTTIVLASNGRVESWNIAEDRLYQKIDTGEPSETKLHMFGRGGTRLATAEKGRIEIWNLDDNCMIRHLTKRKTSRFGGDMLPMAFSHDCNKLVMVENHNIFVYDLEKHHDLCLDAKQIYIHELGLDYFDTHPVFTKSDRIAVPYGDNVYFWAKDGEYLGMVSMEVEGLLCFSDDETQIAAVDFQMNVSIWDVALSVESNRSIKKHCAIQDFFISGDGRELATITGDQIKVWETRTGALSRSLEIPCLFSMSFSSDLRWLAWTNNDGFIRFWDIRKNKLAIEVPDRYNGIPTNERIYFSHPGSNLVAIWSADGEIAIWNLRSRSRKPHTWRSQLPSDYSSFEGLRPFAFSLLSPEFFLSHPKTGIEVYDHHTGVCERTFKLPHDSSEDHMLLYLLFLSDDGLRLVVQTLQGPYDYSILDVWTGGCLMQVKCSSPNLEFGRPMMSTQYGVLDYLNGRLIRKSSYEGGKGRFYIWESTIKPDDCWIMCGERKIIWVPSEFRSDIKSYGSNNIRAVGNTMVFRDTRGGVFCLRFL